MQTSYDAYKDMKPFMMHLKGAHGVVVAAQGDVVWIDVPPPVAAPPQLPVLLHVAARLCHLHRLPAGTEG